MRNNQKQFRVDKSFDDLYKQLKIECIKKNLKVPTQKEFTRLIAKRYKKENIIYEEFIKI